MAEDNDVSFVPHGWNTALGLAADLQLASACRNASMVEYLTGSPFVDGLVAAPWELDEAGMLAIPHSPGPGINMNMDAGEKYTGERFDSRHPTSRRSWSIGTDANPTGGAAISGGAIMSSANKSWRMCLKISTLRKRSRMVSCSRAKRLRRCFSCRL